MAAYLEKAKEYLQLAVGKVPVGVKRLSYKKEIKARREHVRDIKREWGVNMFDAMENKDRDQIQLLYEILLKRIESNHEEIHLFEKNLLALEKPQESMAWKKIIIIADSPDKKVLCHKCNGVITGESIECGNGEYIFHPDCFACASCSKQFASAQCLFFEGKPICETCGEKIANSLTDWNETDLLQWCEKHLAPFNINAKDFNYWYNGVAFAALVANWKPYVLDWTSLWNPDKTHTVAFNGASKAGVFMLLDAEYLFEADKQSIMTQLAMFKRAFALEKPHVDGQRQWNESLAIYRRERAENPSLRPDLLDQQKDPRGSSPLREDYTTLSQKDTSTSPIQRNDPSTYPRSDPTPRRGETHETFPSQSQDTSTRIK